jgi:lysyl-tRNA synthetase class 2
VAEDLEPDLPAVMRDRREKLERLRASGIDPYSRELADADEPGGQSSPGRERADGSCRGGRPVMVKAPGGVVFADLQDGEGRIQLMANRDKLGERVNCFADLDAGDIIGRHRTDLQDPPG